MWTVFKFEKKEFHLLKEDLKKKIGPDCIIYRPKVVIHKYKNNKLVHKEVDILGDYLFCYHKNFEKKSTIEHLKFSRGLKYLLDGFIEFQSDLKKFIERCKNLENEKGIITQNLFELNINSKFKFNSGPFIDKIFKIVNFEKNKINILIGDIKTTISKKEFLFNPL